MTGNMVVARRRLPVSRPQFRSAAGSRSPARCPTDMSRCLWSPPRRRAAAAQMAQCAPASLIGPTAIPDRSDPRARWPDETLARALDDLRRRFGPMVEAAPPENRRPGCCHSIKARPIAAAWLRRLEAARRPAPPSEGFAMAADLAMQARRGAGDLRRCSTPPPPRLGRPQGVSAWGVDPIRPFRCPYSRARYRRTVRKPLENTAPARIGLIGIGMFSRQAKNLHQAFTIIKANRSRGCLATAQPAHERETSEVREPTSSSSAARLTPEPSLGTAC